ncbi:response regulator [Methylolobus aquaticus]|nr:response regulator [Methylolobus aquaticus]
MRRNVPLLIVEDSDEDFEVTCWALRKVGVERPIIRCTSTEGALGYLLPPEKSPDPAPPLPCLVLLDLNLPTGDGRQLLEDLNRLPRRPPVPLVILSTSSNPRDVVACYRLGASGYLSKPLDLDDFVEKLRVFAAYWFMAVTLPEGER